MKPVFIIFFALIFSLNSSSAQNSLSNTKWAGIANIPSAVEVVFEFGKDSLSMKSNNEVLELMKYTVKGDSLVINKISGMSPCGDSPAVYSFSIKNDVLIIKPVTDPCDDRAGAFNTDGYKKKS